jgi:hypothetical protein
MFCGADLTPASAWNNREMLPIREEHWTFLNEESKLIQPHLSQSGWLITISSAQCVEESNLEVVHIA